jgi:hypothetical protein
MALVHLQDRGTIITSVFLPWRAHLGNPLEHISQRTLPPLRIDIHSSLLSPPWGCYVALAPSAMDRAALPYQKSQCKTLAPLPSGKHRLVWPLGDSRKYRRRFI